MAASTMGAIPTSGITYQCARLLKSPSFLPFNAQCYKKHHIFAPNFIN